MPWITSTLAAPDATTVPEESPSTRATKLWRAAESGKRTTTFSPVLESGRAPSGRSIGASASVSIVPDTSEPLNRS